MRAGATVLTLLGTARIPRILRSLSDGAKGQVELRRDAGLPAQSTLRGHLKALEDVDAASKRRRDSFPGALEYELTGPGRELLGVAGVLQHWLDGAKHGPLGLDSDPARAAIKGLVGGWLATMLAPLASEALSLTELDKRLTTVSYPTLERRLETMRLNEQVDLAKRDGAGTPFTLSSWLRLGIASLAAAARWEHRNRPQDATPIARVDLESAVKITAALLTFPPELSGTCRLAVAGDGRKRGPSGTLELREGALAFTEAQPDRTADALASATVDAWFAASLDADLSGLNLSGETGLVKSILREIHRTLFAVSDQPGALAGDDARS
jgi:DNA-binding HxlR family transcriptional regulator